MLQSEAKILDLPLYSSAPAEDSMSANPLTDSLIENIRLISISSSLSDEEHAVLRAASHIVCAIWTELPETSEALIQSRPEWRRNEQSLRRLVKIGLHPELREMGKDSHPEEIFRDAIIALDAKKDSEEAITRRLAVSGKITSSNADWFRKELERLRKLKFSTITGQLRFGRALEKNITDLDEASAHFLGNTSSIRNQKMTLSIYRSVTRNMINMITLADRKAGLLLHANAISLTLLLAFLGKAMLTNRRLWAPSLLIAGTCAITAIFASLAARPIRRTKDPLKLHDFLAANHSLLHYGDIARLSRDDFLAGFQIATKDPELLQNHMLSEIHFFANRIIDKFRMIRKAYLTMITGILLACIALLGSHYFQ